MSDTFDHEGDAWDCAFWGRTADEGYRCAPRAVTCRHCGKPGLKWHQAQRWALIEPNGGLHQCRRETAAEAFAAPEQKHG